MFTCRNSEKEISSYEKQNIFTKKTNMLKDMAIVFWYYIKRAASQLTRGGSNSSGIYITGH
jgi:hypothetical protein